MFVTNSSLAICGHNLSHFILLHLHRSRYPLFGSSPTAILTDQAFPPWGGFGCGVAVFAHAPLVHATFSSGAEDACARALSSRKDSIASFAAAKDASEKTGLSVSIFDSMYMPRSFLVKPTLSRSLRNLTFSRSAWHNCPTDGSRVVDEASSSFTHSPSLPMYSRRRVLLRPWFARTR